MTNLSLPVVEPLASIDVVLLVWFAITAISTARSTPVRPPPLYVTYDAFTKNPEMTVMNWGWVLVTLYLGPGRFGAVCDVV